MQNNKNRVVIVLRSVWSETELFGVFRDEPQAIAAIELLGRQGDTCHYTILPRVCVGNILSTYNISQGHVCWVGNDEGKKAVCHECGEKDHCAGLTLVNCGDGYKPYCIRCVGAATKGSEGKSA